MEASSSPFGSSELLDQVVPFQGTVECCKGLLSTAGNGHGKSLQLGKPGVPDQSSQASPKLLCLETQLNESILPLQLFRA